MPNSVGEKIKYAVCVQNGEGFENYPKWSIGIKSMVPNIIILWLSKPPKGGKCPNQKKDFQSGIVNIWICLFILVQRKK